MKSLLQSAYVGMTAGFLAVMLLNRWLWLEMRVTVSFALPAATLAGMLLPVLFRTSPGAGKALMAQLFCILIFLYLFDFDLRALLVVPATWFREGFCLEFLSIHELNLVLSGIIIIGNGSFLAPKRIFPELKSAGR